MDYRYIPEELKRLFQWVNVKGNSKIPMQSVCNKTASSTNPETWSSFDDAASAVFDGRYDDIGFVFADNGYVGIDIDDGFRNGFLTELAVDIMKHCHSYTEKSRSGRGIHIILKGTLPFKGKNNQAGVEIYRTARYFITTGKKLIYPDIIENQEAIDYVVQTYFPETLRESEEGMGVKLYRPIYPRLAGGRIAIRPIYPPIGKGSRNLSLTSLAGQLHSQGYDAEVIFGELLIANEQACDPPLPKSEVEGIVQSVIRYRR